MSDQTDDMCAECGKETTFEAGHLVHYRNLSQLCADGITFVRRSSDFPRCPACKKIVTISWEAHEDECDERSRF